MQRNLYVDVLKLVMAFLIVALHGQMFYEVNDLVYYIFHEGVTRLGVPVFLLISGF